MEGSGGVAWTPDGKLIYSSFTGIGAHLWIGDSDGSARQLTESSPLNITPAVSPDGRTIVFASALSTGPGKTNLWRMDRDGGNLKQLTQGGFDYFPQVSPDGKWIVYQSILMPLGSTLRKVPMDGGAPVELTAGDARAPGISPDGRWIAFQAQDPRTHKAMIDVIPFDGGEPAHSIEAPPDVGGLGDIGPGLAWANDGRGIYCVRTIKGVSNLWRLPIEGGAPKQVTDFGDERIYTYAWSPSGAELAVARGDRATDVVLVTDLR